MATRKGIQTNTRHPGYFIAGSIVVARQQITAVPTDGRSTKVRIAQGTRGIVEEGSIPGIAPGDPTLQYIAFEKGERTVSVAIDPRLVSNP